MGQILIIDDEEQMCALIEHFCVKHKHVVDSVYTLTEGIQRAMEGTYDVVFLDVHMPDGLGLTELPRIRSAPSAPEVIIMTGMTSPDGAELAIRSGAWDYVEKGSPMEEFILPMLRAMEFRQEKLAQRESVVALKCDGMIGSSPCMVACFDRLAQAAASDLNVLIACETGTGKELAARAIHANSARARGPFVVVDCAALPDTLAESVLFGHCQGAFTGANRSRSGLVKEADGGTLFLDEVGELTPALQKVFLRVIQNHDFRPVGSRREETSDFRLVAATNCDLEEAAAHGKFREDLLFRLRAMTIELPPLRDRKVDVKDIALYHLARVCERNGSSIKGFSPGFLDTLLAHDWPGNIRELVHAIEHAVAAAMQFPTLYARHLPPEIRVKLARAAFATESEEPAPTVLPRLDRLPTLSEFREAAVDTCERQYLQALLAHHGQHIREACDISGMSRSRLYALLHKHGLTRASGAALACPAR